MSIADRIAALQRQSQTGNIPVHPAHHPPAPSCEQTTTTTGLSAPSAHRPRPPPPPRPNVPARPDRSQTASVPPGNDHPPGANRPVGNQPAGPATNGPSARPPLPARSSTQSSQISQVTTLAPRTTSDRPSPALPPRRPSEAPSQPDFDRSRRASTDSQSSVGTTRSSLSGISNATSLTSQGERYRIRAPDYDPNSLPPLPPKRTKEEKEAADRKYAGVRPLRQTKSSPKVGQLQQGTTPPPPAIRLQAAVPPPLPNRTASALQVPPQAIEPTPRPTPQTVRTQPPPPPMRKEPAPPPPRAEPLPLPRTRQSALSFGMNKSNTSVAPVRDASPDLETQTNGAPPPIPSSSKPDLAALQASKPKPGANASAQPAGPVAISSHAQFKEILSSTHIVVADFYADWCGPCRAFAPDYERLSKEHSRPGQVAFIKINTDHNKDIAQAYAIQAWPTIFVFEVGKQVEKWEGANEWGITSTVKDLLRKAPTPAVSTPREPAEPSQGSCLHCRDFSAPDNHAARFPRESIPSQDIGWLAQQLTSPFPSHTDKARAIFTWLHHNIAYNTEAFFNNNVKSSTPQSTLSSGLAVCEGYAGLFAALAMKVGVEAIVVVGNGKGYGYSQLKPGDPIPPYESGHAWNAVKIDGGEWKLLDACWGAGAVNGKNQPYQKRFAPERFTQSNNDFGLDHYPENSNHQFRTDGRRVSWEEYITSNKNGCGANFYSGYVSEEGFSRTTYQPQTGKISPAHQPGPTVRFSFQKVCPHWDPVRNGKGPHHLYVLKVDALKNTQSDNIPFETNGAVWWCDVPVQDLGRSGQKVRIMAVTSFAGKDGRGLGIQEYRRERARGHGPGGGFVCDWEIA